MFEGVVLSIRSPSVIGYQATVIMTSKQEMDCANCRFKLSLQFVLLGVTLVTVALLTWQKILDVTLLTLVVGAVLTVAGISGYQAGSAIQQSKGGKP